MNFKFLFAFIFMLTATQMTDENVSKNFQDPLSRSRAEISLETTFAILICLAFILVYVLVLYIVNRYSEFILLNVEIEPGMV